MGRGVISSGRAWFSRVFPGWAGPSEVDEVAVVTVPLAGAGRYHDANFEIAFDTASTGAVLSSPPEDKQYWIPYAECYHDDTALTTNMWLTIRDPALNHVAIASLLAADDEARLTLKRPIIIGPGYSLAANLFETTGAGKLIRLKMYFVVMPIGEYVPPI